MSAAFPSAEAAVAKGPWGPPPVRIGPLATTSYLDRQAAGYFARVQEAPLLDAAAVLNMDQPALAQWDQLVDAESDRRWRQAVAVKVMRPTHLQEADVYGAFAKEAALLTLFADDARTTPLLGMGFVESSSRDGSGRYVVRWCPDADAFADALASAQHDRLVPYLVLGCLPWSFSLYRMLRLPVDELGSTAALPLPDKLAFADAFLSFLEDAQAQQIYYLDHKLEHVYWLRGNNGAQLAMIDFNACRMALASADARRVTAAADLANAFAAVLYPLFVGLTVAGQPIMPRVSSVAQVPNLATGLRWNAESLEVDFFHREQRFPELGDPALRLLLSWGLAPSAGPPGQAPTKGAVAARLARLLAVNAQDLAPERGVAAARAGFRALRTRLQGHPEVWRLLVEACRCVQEGERHLRHARDLCERAAGVEGVETADSAAHVELRRIYVALLEQQRRRVYP